MNFFEIVACHGIGTGVAGTGRGRMRPGNWAAPLMLFLSFPWFLCSSRFTSSWNFRIPSRLLIRSAYCTDVFTRDFRIDLVCFVATLTFLMYCDVPGVIPASLIMKCVPTFFCGCLMFFSEFFCMFWRSLASTICLFLNENNYINSFGIPILK